MAYDTYLEERITRILEEKRANFLAKKMMGGLCYMVNDKMCIGIIKNQLMCRVGEDAYEGCIQKEGCQPMNFTKRPMKGYVFVSPDAVDSDADLSEWIQLCLHFNSLAKASKKKLKI